MIDTIILTIKQDKYRVINLRRFGVAKEEDFYRSVGFDKFINNPTAIEKEQGYYPRLTLLKRADKDGSIKFPLKIEFSAPKMIFNNNLNEVEEKDFDRLVEILQSRIKEMGVLTTKQSIKESPISGFHPSKNILITDGYTATLAIKELSKVNLTKKLDLDETRFRNDGHSLQYYSKIHSLVFYDKISDLNKPEKRAIDKDQTNKQRNLFEKIKESEKPMEVLKIEVRLSYKRKMNTVLKELNFTENPTLQDIFKRDVCQKILQLYWNNMVAENNLFLFDVDNNPQSIIRKLFSSNPLIPAKQAIYFVGLNLLCKDDGILSLRDIINSYRPKTNWARIQKNLSLFNNPLLGCLKHGFVKNIEDQLNKLEPLSVEIKP